jgi:hypothetical protein
MNTLMIIARLQGAIRDFFLFARSEDIEPAARQISDFLKGLESQDPNPFDTKILHDAVNGFNKALTGK